MRKKFTLFMACMVLFSAIFTCNNISVQAKTKAKITSTGKKAIKEYQKFLGQSMIQWSDRSYSSDKFQFILVDVNKDGVPELFLHNMGYPSHYEGYEAVYSYYKGGVHRITCIDEITSYYPQGGIVETEHYGMGGYTWYNKILKNGKAREVASIDHPRPAPNEKTVYYWGNGKKKTEVSKSKFNSLLKKATGKKKVKIKDSDWHDNTAKNRKQMAKLIMSR